VVSLVYLLSIISGAEQRELQGSIGSMGKQIMALQKGNERQSNDSGNDNPSFYL